MTSVSSLKEDIKVEAKSLKRLTSQDLFLIKLIEDCKISPHGEEILYVVKTIDPEKNEYKTHFEIIPFHGKPLDSRAFTQGPHDSSPEYSPDGKQIAFLRKKDGHSTLFMMPRGGGEPVQLTKYKNDISEFSWSPDGKKIVFTSSLTAKGLICEEAKPEENLYEKHNADVKVIDRIWYKLDGEGYLHDKRSHIFILTLETGVVKQLTSGEHDHHQPRFSPDGKWIAFTSNLNQDSDYEYFSYIYLVSSEGGTPKNLTPGKYYFSGSSFSPDGKWLAFTGTDEPENGYASPRLWKVSTNGGGLECLTKQHDRPVSDQSINDLRHWHPNEVPLWSKNGEKLYLTMSDSGRSFLISFDLSAKTIKEYCENDSVLYKWDFSPQTNRMVFAKSTPTIPNDLWNFEVETQKSERLTDVNELFSNTFSLSSPERITSKSSDGTLVEGWILKPPDFKPEKKYPTILEIHGGPMAMYGCGFFYEFQLLVNQGFVVAYSNPRGSMGYGQPFCESIKADWGNKDYQDLMGFLDAVLTKGYSDDTKLGVAGGSYGGFMTNWIVSHTNRFKAGVTMRSVVSENTMFGTSDFGFLSDLEHGCTPWEKPEVYQRVSPLTYVANVKTPLLILHSEEDLRCPIEQGEQWFTALKKLKQTVKFVRFPGESHDLSRTGKPWHRIFRLNQILEWFKTYL